MWIFAVSEGGSLILACPPTLHSDALVMQVEVCAFLNAVLYRAGGEGRRVEDYPGVAQGYLVRMAGELERLVHLQAAVVGPQNTRLLCRNQRQTKGRGMLVIVWSYVNSGYFVNIIIALRYDLVCKYMCMYMRLYSYMYIKYLCTYICMCVLCYNSFVHITECV